MKILAIETSCDETATAVLECAGTPPEGVSFDVRANIIHSQVALHAEYGGVFPSLAKREHSRNLVPVLKKALGQGFGISNSQFSISNQIPNTKIQKIKNILEREPELLAQFLEFIQTIQKPPIDAIAVTYGPGLEPALWVGVNFAKALALTWDLPIIPVNHMEGHFFSALLKKNDTISDIQHIPILSRILGSTTALCAGRIGTIYNIQKINFPILALLVSGGHTELVLSKTLLQYERVGETRDDAAGEAFDKVARMLGLSYPGGPAVAEEAEKWSGKKTITLPRPMKDSGDYNFSFSGLKTAVLYKIKKIPELTPELIQEFSHEFQEAVTDVLVSKTVRAAEQYGIRTIAMGGGVSANETLREALKEKVRETLSDTELFIAPRKFTGDNAVMIGVAAYLNQTLKSHKSYASDPEELRAEGVLRLGG